MARSFVYERSLDAKILPNTENSNHMFQFNTFSEIKQEVENETLDMENELSPGAAATESSAIYDDHDRELQSANTADQIDKSNDALQPKLVIKFRDLWKKSEQSDNFPKKRKRSKGSKSKSKIQTLPKLIVNKRRKLELSASSEDRITRSSLSRSRLGDRNQETESISNCSQQEATIHEEENKDIRNLDQTTQLMKDSEFSCESCGMCFRNSKQLNVHRRYYTAAGEFQCTICGRKFSRDFQLSRHIKAAHSTRANDDIYKFKCKFCTERFEREVSLITHVMHHHNKHYVSNKTSIIAKNKLTSLLNLSATRMKKEACAKKSKHVRKSVAKIDPTDQEIISHGNSDSSQNSNRSVENLCDKNELSVCESSRVLRNECPGYHLTNDNLDSNNKKANTSSTQRLINTNYPEHINTVFLEKSGAKEVTVQQQIHSSINGPSKKSSKPRDAEEMIDQSVLSSRVQSCDKSTAVPILQKRNEERNQMQLKNQTGLELEPENVRVQLGGDLIDNLGNKVGQWCLSESIDQPDKSDNVFGDRSASTTVDGSPELEMAKINQCTRTSTLRTTMFNSPIVNTMDTATCSNQELIQNEDSSVQGKSINATEDNYTTSKVRPHLDDVHDRLQLLPQHQQLDQQVGSVLSDQVSEDLQTATRNVNADNAAVECNEFGIDLIQVDDFGETHESTLVDFENEKMSDDSCESIPLKMTASSSIVSLGGSANLESDDVTTLTSCNSSNDPKIKDVRVLLVKLENMVDLSTKSNPPESSPLHNYNLVKTETFYCNLCDKQFVSQLGLQQHCRRKHNSEEVEPNEESKSIVRKKRVITNKCGKVLPSKNMLTKRPKLRQGIETVKRCYFCHEVFQNIMSGVSHYLSVHTEVGIFQCCICYINFKNLRKLRLHLFKHYNGFTEEKSKISCRVCKKELGIPELNQRCLECNRNSKTKQCDSKGDQFLNAQDSIERQSAYTQASENAHASENGPVSQFKISSPSMSKEKAESNTPVFDHESAKNDKKVGSSGICEKINKNFKCSACHRVFFESSQLKHHLLTVHADAENCKWKNVKPQILSHSTSRKCKNETSKYCKNKNNLPKFNVGRKKNFKSKHTGVHDKLCNEKLYARRRLRLLQINSKNQHSIRQHNIRGNTKTRYNYKCDICGLNCCCRRTLKIHKTRYLTNGNNVCNICGLTFAWKHVLAIHMKTAHNPNILFRSRVRCTICNQGFYHTKFLRIHLAHFHSMKYFQCRVCCIRFDTLRSLNNHRRYYSKNRSSVCDICGQSLKSKYMLEYHKAHVHNHEKLKAYKYFCDVCDCAFINKLLLQAHIGHLHNMQDCDAETNANNEDVSKVTEGLAENIELLEEIEIGYNNSNGTTNNSSIGENVNKINRTQEMSENVVGKTIKTHTSGEYKCNICKISFHDPYAILNHEWEFSNDGTYSCHVCNRRFMTDSLLKNHRIKHYQRSVIRKYECHVCKEDFSRVDDLKTHGLHLHGPQFVSEEIFETADIFDENKSESRVNRDCDSLLDTFSIDDTYDTIELVARSKVPHNGRIQLFQKIGNNRSATESLRRNSNEDTYCCNFCRKNFSSSTLLKDHIKKHTYCAYYTNSSRYLCLICKNKFRTNDILRAHVIHCHSFDQQEENLSQSRSSDNSVPNEPTKSGTHSNNGQTGIAKDDNEAERVVGDLPSKHTIQKPLPSSKICNSIQQSTATPPSERRHLSNSTRDVDILQSDQAHRTSMPCEVEYESENHLECNDSSEGNDRNTSNLVLLEIGYSEITPHIAFNSTEDEVDLFTVKMSDANGFLKWTCTICIVIFHTVTQFRQHFASTHVQNGAYSCTYCEKKFLVMSDMKYHIFKHKEFQNYICCGRKFRLTKDFVRHKLSHIRQTEGKQNESITDVVHHKLSHAKQTKRKQNKSITQSSPLFEAGSLKEFDNKSNVDKEGNPCKCEICDTVFVDFQTILKHWDSCIETNGLQCNLCKVTFNSLNSFRTHQMTYHEKKQNYNTIQNRQSFRVNGNQTVQALMESNITHSNKLGGNITIDKSVNVNTTKKLERAGASTGKLSKQIELRKSETVTLQPFARPLQNLKNLENNDECRVNEHQENDANDATRPRLEFESNKVTRLSKQPQITKTAPKQISIENLETRIPLETKGNVSIPSSVISRPVKLITQECHPDKKVSNNIPYNTDENRLLYHLPVQDSNTISEQHFVQNDFSLGFRPNEYEELRLASSQPNSSITVNDSSSIQSKAHNSIKIVTTKPTSSESVEESRSNDCEAERPLNLLPLNAAGSVASPNATDNTAYYLCIQPAVDQLNDINSATVVPSGSSQITQPNYGSGEILSNLVPFPVNPGISPTYFLCIQPTSDNSSTCITQTAPLNDAELDFSPEKHIKKKRPRLLCKSSSVGVNPIHASDIQQLPNNTNSMNKQNVVSNHAVSGSHSNNNDTRVPILSAIAGTSTGGNLPESHKNATIGESIPMDKSASNKESVLTKQVVRCSYCNLLFTEQTKLIAHMESHKTDNQCPACGLTFSNEKALAQHLPEHKSSTCTKCNMIVFFSDSLSRPMGIQRHCSACNSLLPLPRRKQNRLAKHSARQVIKCGICLATFDTISQMTVHFKEVHSTFVCGICESKFSTQTTLYSHMQTHVSYADTTLHMQSHVKTLEIFECKPCRKYFICESDLAEHVSSH